MQQRYTELGQLSHCMTSCRPLLLRARSLVCISPSVYRPESRVNV